MIKDQVSSASLLGTLAGVSIWDESDSSSVKMEGGINDTGDVGKLCAVIETNGVELDSVPK
jgi:hypothetical protein